MRGKIYKRVSGKIFLTRAEKTLFHVRKRKRRWREGVQERRDGGEREKKQQEREREMEVCK